jgi:hypothetical protein
MTGPNRRARRRKSRSGLSWQNPLPVQLVSRTGKKRGSELKQVYHDDGRSGIIACCTAACILVHHWCKAAPPSLASTTNPWFLIRLKFLLFLFLLNDGPILFLFDRFLIRRERVLQKTCHTSSLIGCVSLHCVHFSFIWTCFFICGRDVVLNTHPDVVPRCSMSVFYGVLWCGLYFYVHFCVH